MGQRCRSKAQRNSTINTGASCWTVGLPASYFPFCSHVPWKLSSDSLVKIKEGVGGGGGSKQITTCFKTGKSTIKSKFLSNSRVLVLNTGPNGTHMDHATGFNECAHTRESIPDVHKHLHQHTRGSKHSIVTRLQTRPDFV